MACASGDGPGSCVCPDFDERCSTHHRSTPPCSRRPSEVLQQKAFHHFTPLACTQPRHSKLKLKGPIGYRTRTVFDCPQRWKKNNQNQTKANRLKRNKKKILKKAVLSTITTTSYEVQVVRPQTTESSPIHLCVDIYSINIIWWRDLPSERHVAAADGGLFHTWNRSPFVYSRNSWQLWSCGDSVSLSNGFRAVHQFEMHEDHRQERQS